MARSFPWDGGATGQADWPLMVKAYSRYGVIYDGDILAGKVTPGSGRAVSVAANRSWIAGVLCEETTATSITLDAEATAARTDIIAWKVDKTAKTATQVAVKGVSVVPAETATLIYEPLALVRVAVGATAFVAADIDDLRRWANDGPQLALADPVLGADNTSIGATGSVGYVQRARQTVVADTGRLYEVRARELYTASSSAYVPGVIGILVTATPGRTASATISGSTVKVGTAQIPIVGGAANNNGVELPLTFDWRPTTRGLWTVGYYARTNLCAGGGNLTAALMNAFAIDEQRR